MQGTASTFPTVKPSLSIPPSCNPPSLSSRPFSSECTSFFYNEAAQSCILKKDECFNEPNLVVSEAGCPGTLSWHSACLRYNPHHIHPPTPSHPPHHHHHTDTPSNSGTPPTCTLASSQVDTPAFCTYPLFEENVPLPVGDQTVVCGFGYTYFRSSTPLPAGCIPT